MASGRPVTTGELTKELGLSVRTVQRYRREGWISPVLVAQGQHARWDIDQVKEQLRVMAEKFRDAAGREQAPRPVRRGR
ncbi:MerR family DNA-binding transcriptional regulator [Pseudonocardia yunnanensis]|uniref:MerR family DNA-binding transcriptional regulator n=1 Tax=Pseudonocardia yunnanensis TaxID=58107 RepID=A0ABW4EP00_9PSEU